MPKSCVAYGCTNHNMKNEGKVSFHVFPKDSKRRDMWIHAVHRQNEDGSKWEPSAHAVLCGKHFIEGKPNSDPSHPDFVPSIFVHRSSEEKKSISKIKRYESRKRREETLKETAASQERTSKPEESAHSEEGGAMGEADDCEMSFLASVSQEERAKFMLEIANLKMERDRARAETTRLEKKLDKVRLSEAAVRGNDTNCKFHTGLRWEVFFRVFQFLQTFLPDNPPSKQCSKTGKVLTSMPMMDQFFVTLVKLRFGMPFQFIAERTGYSTTLVQKNFWKWIDIMYAKLSFLIKAPDHDTALATNPPQFKAKFPLLTTIIDCFEIFIDQPKNLHARACTFSNYKKHNTVKFLIGCSPQGCITFLSKAWGGRVSDNELVKQSGFLDDRHRPGDQILADRGFTLQEEFALRFGAQLIIPSFCKGKKQLSAQEVEISRNIASVRIHIERIIGLVKNRYAILQGTLPINLVKSCCDEVAELEYSSIDKIVSVCACLVNLGDGIVCKTEDLNPSE